MFQSLDSYMNWELEIKLCFSSKRSGMQLIGVCETKVDYISSDL